MTTEEFYQGLPDVMGTGATADFLPDVVYTELSWWDSLMLLRLLDYLETAGGSVVSPTLLQQNKTWGQLASAIVDDSTRKSS
jgi:hypothetical protein